MNIDPRNVAFIYIDKLALAIAALIAVVSVLGSFTGESPADGAIEQIAKKIETFEAEREIAAAPESKVREEYATLQERFDANSIPAAKRFRDHVFFTPYEKIGPKLPVKYHAGLDISQQNPGVYGLADFGFRCGDIEGMKSSSNIIKLEQDEARNAIMVRPLGKGTSSVRVFFKGGSTLDFDVEVTEKEIFRRPEPQTPVDIAATATEGRIQVTFKTNPETSPVETYSIYRSTVREEYGSVAGKIETMNREETPEQAIDPFSDEPPAAVVHRYIFDDIDVTPGTTYYYRVQATGKVMLEDGSIIERNSNLGDRVPVEVAAGPPFEIAVVGGVAGMASIEVTRWNNFVPEFRNFTIRPGEPIGQSEFDTGFVLVSVEDTMVEQKQTRRIPVREPDGQVVFKEMEITILTPGTRAILANKANEVRELGRQPRNSDRIKDDIKRILSDYANFSAVNFPKFDPPEPAGDSRANPQIEIINNDAVDLLFIVLGRYSFARVLVPAYQTRLISFDRGSGYELTAIYDNVKEVNIFKLKDMQLKFNEKYTFEFQRMPAAGK